MTTKQETKQSIDQEKKGRQHLDALIGKHVMHTLGQPGGLHSLQVRHLWDDHYRVNVLLGPDAVSAKVAHSYFLVGDSNGNVITSNPKITRQY